MTGRLILAITFVGLATLAPAQDAASIPGMKTALDTLSKKLSLNNDQAARVEKMTLDEWSEGTLERRAEDDATILRVVQHEQFNRAQPERPAAPASLGRRSRWWLEYAVVRSLEAVSVVLPRNVVHAMGAWLGLAARTLAVRRSVVIANLRHVGLGDDEQIRCVVPELYKNMGRYCMDLLRAPRKMPAYRIHGREILRNLDDKGTIALGAHFGNFELLASVFGTSVGDLHVIVKAMHNPFVERWLDKRRFATGVHTIHHAKATRKALTILKRKGCVAVLVDQHPGRDGTPVPLLGQTASTVRAVAGLQERTRAHVVSAYAILGSDGVYDVYLAVEPFELDGLGREARLSRIQERHNEIIGEWIRERPEHWFGWFHRRFKPFLEY